MNLKRKVKRKVKKRKRRRPPKIVTGYDLGVTYVPSHRNDKLRIKRSMRDNQIFTTIHNFKPAEIKTIELKGKKGKKVFKAVSRSIYTPGKFRSRNPLIPAALRGRMERGWGSIFVNYSFRKFHISQFRKHGQHHLFKTDADYYEQGLRHGRRYLRGRRSLMRIMKKRGYKPGYMYHCSSFVKALNEELEHPVFVNFKHATTVNGEDMKYLDGISSLYDLKSDRYQTCRRQKYDKTKIFHLEDFSRVLKGKRMIEPSLKLKSVRLGLTICRVIWSMVPAVI